MNGRFIKKPVVQVIKFVHERKNGQKKVYGAVCLPSGYIDKYVLIIPLSKMEQDKYVEQIDKFKKEKQKKQDKLINHLIKLKKLRNGK